MPVLEPTPPDKPRYVPRLLDLFCGAGGCSEGYARAGFEVVGVDIEPQPNYPFPFVQRDALDVLGDLIDGRSQRMPTIEASNLPVALRTLDDFDAIHASPPCQALSAGRHMPRSREHADLILATRRLLDATGLPYVIENVVGAPLMNPVTLCAAAFGLHADGHHLSRHRLFETNWQMGLVPPCAHGSRPVIGIYGDRAKTSRGATLTIRSSRWSRPESLSVGGRAMGIDWMTWRELREAIPPVYTEYIGAYLLAEVRHR